MREISDEVLIESAQDIFYGIIHPYMEFFEKKEYSKVLRLVVYGDIIFLLGWKKCYKKHFLVTKFFPREGYNQTEDDTFLLQHLNDYLTPSTIEKVTKWYKKCEKENNIAVV